MGWSFKKVFSNPTKTFADVSTFGGTAVLRALPKKLGGGQKGIFSKGSEVYGATGIGVLVGFLTGGPPGAAVGGASAFGRGVSGVVHKESGGNIAGDSAKWAAITGGAAGFVKGTGVAGFVRNTVFSGSPKVPAVKNPISSFSVKNALSAIGLQGLASKFFNNSLLPASFGPAVDVPSINNYPQAIDPSRLYSVSPSGLSDSPGVIDAQLVTDHFGENKSPWLLLLLGALLVVLVAMKRRKR